MPWNRGCWVSDTEPEHTPTTLTYILGTLSDLSFFSVYDRPSSWFSLSSSLLVEDLLSLGLDQPWRLCITGILQHSFFGQYSNEYSLLVAGPRDVDLTVSLGTGGTGSGCGGAKFQDPPCLTVTPSMRT